MIDKKINQTIDALIKKIKDNDLGSIKLSNKTNTIEISNKSITLDSNQNTQNTLPINDHSSNKDTIDSFISIDSPMVGIIYLTPKPSSPPLCKKRSEN